MSRGKDKRKGHHGNARGKADPVSIQIHVAVKKPIVKGKRIAPTKELMGKVIERFIETGDLEPVKGFRVTGIDWENYGRHKPTQFAETEEEIEEARTTLRLRDMLRKRGAGFFEFRTWGEIETLADPCLTMCDYDFPQAPRLRPVFALAHTIGLKPHWMRLDRTRRGWHLIIKWNKRLLPSEAVAIQAVLGSDRNRERLNLMRVMSLRLHPNAYAARRWNLMYRTKLT